MGLVNIYTCSGPIETTRSEHALIPKEREIVREGEP
jgi:hypothetical protein